MADEGDLRRPPPAGVSLDLDDRVATLRTTTGGGALSATASRHGAPPFFVLGADPFLDKAQSLRSKAMTRHA